MIVVQSTDSGDRLRSNSRFIPYGSWVNFSTFQTQLSWADKDRINKLINKDRSDIYFTGLLWASNKKMCKYLT